MKRTLCRVLIGLNLLIVLLLLLLSGAMLYLSSAHPAALFGHSAVLLLGEKPQLCIVDPHSERLLPTETLLYRSEEDGLLLLTVDRNDGKQIYCTNWEGGIPLADPHLEGQVTSQHPLLGSFFAALIGPDRLVPSYVGIGVGFVLCLLAAGLSWYLLGRGAVPLVESEEDLELLREVLGGEIADAALDSSLDEEDEPLPQPEEDYPAPLGSGKKSGGPFPQLSFLRGGRKQDEDEAEPDEEPLPEEPPASVELPMPSGTAAPSEEEEAEEDVRIYTPHSLHPPAASKTETEPEPEPVKEEHVEVPELEDLLRQIEDEFKDI